MSNSSRVVDPSKTTEVPDLDAFEEAIVEDKPGFQMPKKFEGKSPEEIARSAVEAERKMGQQGQELGQLRKQVDQLSRMVQQPEAKTERKPVEVDQLLDNPEGVINDAIDSNERLQTIERKLVEDDLRRNKSVFESRHPDWQQIVASEGFQAWLNSNGERRRRWDEADMNYNYEAGDDIMQTFKDIHAAKSQQAADEKQGQIEQGLRDAGTVRRGSATKSVRKYPRSYLVNLKVSDPDKYEANRSEIEAAYREGRVYQD